ncbi:MAG: polysaccharide deacetylase family protein, partial [Clostridiales bacterium]
PDATPSEENQVAHAIGVADSQDDSEQQTNQQLADGAENIFPGDSLPESDIAPTPPADGAKDKNLPGVMALTFDDGPGKETTPLLLDALKERNIKATFFVLGVRVKAYPSIVERANADGHVICSHGYDHKDKFSKLSNEGLTAQLENTAKLIYGLTDSYPMYVRPPYGDINAATAAKINQPIMLWTIDPRDWDVKDADTICQNIVNTAKDGAVILSHDIYQSTVDGVIKAVDLLTAQGWKFVSLPELYKYLDITPKAGQVYRGASVTQLK